LKEVVDAINAFLETWDDTPEQNKQGFIRLKNLLLSKQDIALAFHPRPGLTYSLRASYPQHKRPLLVMVDVIEDQPRWLSVCFFGDMVQDPEEKGAFVPGGLLGEDALCFDLETCSEEGLQYVEARLDEAYRSAIGS
jgi:hypothetical protein